MILLILWKLAVFQNAMESASFEHACQTLWREIMHSFQEHDNHPTKTISFAGSPEAMLIETLIQSVDWCTKHVVVSALQYVWVLCCT